MLRNPAYYGKACYGKTAAATAHHSTAASAPGNIGSGKTEELQVGKNLVAGVLRGVLQP
jgi:hypothetical protein